MNSLNDLRTTAPDIAAYVERYYAEQPDSATLLDILSPHALAHQVAVNYPGLGAAFYRLVAEAARECWTAMLGMAPDVPPPSLPRVSSALAGLINSKDSSWF